MPCLTSFSPRRLPWVFTANSTSRSKATAEAERFWVISRGIPTESVRRCSGSRAAGDSAFRHPGFTTWTRPTNWSRTTRWSPSGGNWAVAASNRQTAPHPCRPCTRLIKSPARPAVGLGLAGLAEPTGTPGQPTRPRSLRPASTRLSPRDDQIPGRPGLQGFFVAREADALPTELFPLG